MLLVRGNGQIAHTMLTSVLPVRANGQRHPCQLDDYVHATRTREWPEHIHARTLHVVDPNSTKPP